jgi:hypothetical protein
MEVLVVNGARTSLRRLALPLALFLAGASVRADSNLTENDVKAAYLCNFVKFVQWDPNSPQMHGDQIAICILGDDPFGEQLQHLLAGQTIQGKPIKLLHIASAAEADSCSEVFINVPDRQIASTLASLSHPHVLTVGNDPDFVDQGGMVAFRRVGDRVRFDINLRAAEEAHLKISSDLLRLAKRVRGAPASVR